MLGRTSAAGVLCLFVSTFGSSLAQTAGEGELPLTHEGRPDFTGVWTSRGLTMMQRPGPMPLVLSDEAAAGLARQIFDQIRSKEMEVQIDPEALVADVRELHRVGGEWRSSFVTLPEDGQLPYTDEARARLAATRVKELTENSDGPETRSAYDRCLSGTGKAPLYQVPSNNYRQLIQTRDHMLLYAEEGGDLRMARIGGAPVPIETTSRHGDSIANWDGDVLVIETLGAAEYTSSFPWGAIVVGPQSKVIERVSLISADELLYQYTVEDPELYSEPWSAEFSMHRSDSPGTYEYGCHEGNYSMTNILQAARRMQYAAE